MITAEQRLARRNRIGSSDSAAVVGVDPWKSRADVYFEKIADTDDIPNKMSIRIGNAFEPVLVAWAAEELGIEIEVNVNVDAHPTKILAANLDARGVGTACRIGIEAKTTSLPEEYGEQGTDQVPDRVIVQALHQCEVAELDIVYIPVLLARRDRLVIEMFRIPRNEAGQKAIVDRDVEFWHNHVVPRVQPEGMVPSMDILKRIKRQAGKVATIDPGLVSAWEAAKVKRKKAKEEEEEVEAAMLATVGEAEAADFGDRFRWLTYFKQDRKGYEVAPTSFRVLRIQKR